MEMCKCKETISPILLDALVKAKRAMEESPDVRVEINRAVYMYPVSIINKEVLSILIDAIEEIWNLKS